jgi:quercetin dioxygenase-like cupin family protein
VVVSGKVKLEIEGKPALILGPGESFLIPRGTVHQASAPEGEAHVISTYVVDKDKPLATPKP